MTDKNLMPSDELMTGLVSVVIPTYNNAHYISECVESVEYQTYKDIEIIIVDDGSTDNTETIVIDLLQKYRNITYKKIQNSKSPTARNTGIMLAKGEFIASIDADDIWPEYKLELQLKELRKTSGTIVLGEALQFIVDEQGAKVFSNRVPLPRASNNYLDTILNISVHQAVNFNTYLMRTKDMLEDGMWDPSFITAHDWELWARLSKHYTFIHIDKVLQFYRKHPLSTTTNRKNSYSLSLMYQLMLIDRHSEKGLIGFVKNKIFKKRHFEETINILIYKAEFAMAFRHWLSACLVVNIFFLKDALPALLSLGVAVLKSRSGKLKV